MYLMRSTVSTLLKASLGALSFSCGMILNTPLIAQRETITFNREALRNDVMLNRNQCCINYDYFVGQRVLKYDNTSKGKLAVKTTSLFEIVCVHANSTVNIQLSTGVTEQKTFVAPCLIRIL